MKKVCIITATRSEYGALRWLIDEIKNDNQLQLQIVATGTHLSPEFGLTYSEIENDGYQIDEKVDMLLSSSSQTGLVKSMGICSIGFADVFSRLNPDIVVVLGDRYELLPICSAALIMNIPIAHISGGDITEGAIDDQVRNSITMMAALHFPGVEESAKRIERMRGSSDGIFKVGEPGLDNFNRLQPMDRKSIADNLKLNKSSKWILFTYHPETKLTLKENLNTLKNIIDALEQIDNIQVVITGANSDFGGFQINDILQNLAIQNSSKYKFFFSLGQLRYISLMKEVDFLIGNSSSAIIEAPFLKKPVVNIGERQKGRYLCGNVISAQRDIASIQKSLKQVQNFQINDNDSSYYGNGYSTKVILNKLKEYLLFQM